jgi:hypothetical protein
MECIHAETTMKAQPGEDFTDDSTLPDEEMDDLEAWTPQDLDPFGSFGLSGLADPAE